MLLDGIKIAEEILEEIRQAVLAAAERAPCLAVILVGDHPASKIYIARKVKACALTGIESIRQELPASISQEALIRHIDLLNQDPRVDGILIQLPLPPHIRPSSILAAIDPRKDVDGFHPVNVGKLLTGEGDGFIPCTPYGIQVLLQRSGIQTEGLHAVILGRSNIVGKPLAALLMQNTPGANATVTIAHSRTHDIPALTRQADLIVAAMGKPLFLKEEMVKKGAIVVDVGINSIPDAASPKGYRIVGDADFERLKHTCAFITPVPGGVGPMTIAMLLKNTLKSFLQR